MVRILSQVPPQVGITAGEQCFTDLAYADDPVIFLSDEDQAGIVSVPHQALSADEHFNRSESGYQLEETARSSQENMDLSDYG